MCILRNYAKKSMGLALQATWVTSLTLLNYLQEYMFAECGPTIDEKMLLIKKKRIKRLFLAKKTKEFICIFKVTFIIVFIRKIKVTAKASSGFTFLLHIFWEKKNFRSWNIPIVSCIKSVKTRIKEHNSDGVLATVPKMTSLAADCIQIFRAGVLTHSLRSMRRNSGLAPTP